MCKMAGATGIRGSHSVAKRGTGMADGSVGSCALLDLNAKCLAAKQIEPGSPQLFVWSHPDRSARPGSV